MRTPEKKTHDSNKDRFNIVLMISLHIVQVWQSLSYKQDLKDDLGNYG